MMPEQTVYSPATIHHFIHDIEKLLKDMEKVVKGPIRNSAWSQEEESDEKEWTGMKMPFTAKFWQYFFPDQLFQDSTFSTFLSLSTATADAIGQGAASDLLFEARDGLPRPRQIQIH